jgi:Ras-related protein Rab-32
VKYDDDTIIRLHLWVQLFSIMQDKFVFFCIIILQDIAGEEQFGNMTRVYYKDAVGCFIVFDVTRESTFKAVTKWKTDLDNKVQLPDGNRVPCILLANKVDFIDNENLGEK